MAKKDTGIFTRKAIGLVIGFIGMFLLVFVVFYTISRIFRPQDLATMLPKDSTVALVQISTNPHHEQVQRFYEELNDYELYTPNSIKSLIDAVLESDFDEDILPWLDRQIGVSVIEKTGDKGKIDVVLFMETKSKGKTLEFLESRGLKTQEDYLLTDNYEGIDIYRYALSQTYNFMFIDKYLVVANNPDVLRTIVDVNKQYSNQLISNELYQKVTQNLPINTLTFAYVDMGKLIETLKENEGFMSEKGKDLLVFEPFLKLYKAFGLTVIMENGNLAIQTFTLLDKDYLAGEDFINFNTKFRANFLNYISNDMVFYVGGLDFQKQIHRYADIMSAGGEVSYLIFEGMLRSQKNKYFGQEIDLEEDIYPLLQGEYAIAVNKNDKHEALSIIIELADPPKDRDKVESIVDSFVRKSAILAPKIVEVELEDGTTMEEVQTVPEEISRSSEDYHGYEINVLTIGTQDWGVYYIIVDNVLIISTQKDQIHASVDLFINSQNSVKNSDIFKELISPIVRTTDEVIYFDVEYVLKKLNLMPGFIAGYIEPFKSVGCGKNYFKDGISSIYYIKID